MTYREKFTLCHSTLFVTVEFHFSLKAGAQNVIYVKKDIICKEGEIFAIIGLAREDSQISGWTEGVWEGNTTLNSKDLLLQWSLWTKNKNQKTKQNKKNQQPPLPL